ncbi:hypothetical protein WJW69_004457 [Salmonella enterica]
MPLTNNSGVTNQTPGSTQIVQGTVFYSRRATPDGWLTVKRTKTSDTIPIHENVKLLYKGVKDGRTYFTVKSDIDKLLDEDISLNSGHAMKYVSATGPVEEEAILYVLYDKKIPDPQDSQSTQFFAKLVCNNNTIITTVTLTTHNPEYGDENFTPLPVGTHKIMVPDYPHSAAGYYLREYPGLIGYNVWFPIKFGNGSRYVHPGQISHGCLTIYTLTSWNSIYDYLITRRTPGTNGKYVGRIIVAGKWE